MAMAGWGLIYSAVFAVAWETFISIKAAHYMTFPLGQIWYALHAASLDGFQSFAAAALPSAITGPLFDLLLTSPAWVLLGALGVLLLGFGRLRSGTSTQRGGTRQLSRQDLGWRGPRSLRAVPSELNRWPSSRR